MKDLSTYGRWFEYSEVESERKHTVTLMHEFGSRWSVFLASYVRGLFETMGTKLEVSSTDASVTFELEKSQSPASALGQLA